MTFADHETYARELLSSLADDQPEIESLTFIPDRTKSRNAAKAMTTIFCHRLFKKSGHQPTQKEKTTYEWQEGVFNCRNIADRDYLWTNMRRSVADRIHDSSRNKPVAYLLAFSDPSGTTVSVWAVPEPILYASLSNLPLKEEGDEYAIQIFTNKHRIENDAASPDLAPYFQEFPLTRPELLVLKNSRELDALVRRERAVARDTTKLMATAAQQLTEAGNFDPSGIRDARERALSSIVRRRGQPAFRQHLLEAYNNRCAITGCELEPVLDAAHIIPYRGPETNHTGNGLLLRTDLHTLFDLKLVAIDVTTMRLLVSPSLAGTCYEEYRGMPIKVPDDPSSRPSRNALEQHRRESGLE